MQRYFTKTKINPITVIDDAPIIHHVFHVMRMKPGDDFDVCTMDKQCFRMKILSLDEKAIECEKQYAVAYTPHPLNIKLAQSLIRKEKFELVIQKASELGAKTLMPLMTSRTIVKIHENALDKKLTRFKKIAKEAAEQTKRNTIMDIDAPTEINTIDFKAYDKVLVAYEAEPRTTTKTIIKALQPGMDVLILIGPEGGFSDVEIDYLKSQGALSIALGPRILRSETAAFYILAAISYELEMSVEL